jgi:predicted nucleotidyltransferase component of viral defense system
VIPKAAILERARDQGLKPTTIEKDYVLGWVLRAIAEDEVLSRWVFKGGTCLKKCFFETYRFSEDLDFTVPTFTDAPGTDELLSEIAIAKALVRLSGWVEDRCGISFPRDRIKVEKYENPRGNPSYQARLTYAGPLQMARGSLQKIKFDITEDEVIASEPELREVHHPYPDEQDPRARVQTYSLEEILAEKSRALYERQGRARDVYDVVHLSRAFHETIDPAKARSCVELKFAFKGIGAPSVASILGRMDRDVVKADWDQQLAHQLPALPSVDGFLEELEDALRWWLEPAAATPRAEPVPVKAGEILIPRVYFPTYRSFGTGERYLETVRFAARNRLCVRVDYHGDRRLVEPYSLRRPKTGNRLLYVHERTKNGFPVNAIRAYKIDEIDGVATTDIPFTPKWLIEL